MIGNWVFDLGLKGSNFEVLELNSWSCKCVEIEGFRNFLEFWSFDE